MALRYFSGSVHKQIVGCHNLSSHGTNETSDFAESGVAYPFLCCKTRMTKAEKGKVAVQVERTAGSVCQCCEQADTDTADTLSGHSEYRYLYISVLGYD